MRYLNSFFITMLLYVSIATLFLFANPFDKIIKEKKEEKKKISLNYVQIIKPKPKPEIKKEKPKIQKQTKVEKKLEPVKKIVKKKPIVKKKKRKKTIKKKMVKKEPKIIKEIVEEKVIKKIEAKKYVVKKTTKIPPKKVNYKKDYLSKYLHLIKKEIQKNVKYSRSARKLGIEGKVLVEFCINKDGDVYSIKTIKGHRLLQKSTIKAIHEASKNFPKVKKPITIRIPIEYRLV